MKHHVRRSLACVLVTLMLFCAVPAGASAAGFTDVPANSWAAKDIDRCVELGLFQGETSTRFGMGHQMTRAAFTVVLCRFFGWEMVKPETGTYADVQDASVWYYSAVETAYANGAITRQTETFRPKDPITREEMAVMLVRALGYGTLAGLSQDLSMPFTDVTTNAGYISMAYELGIINGTSATTFSPDRTATREQAAVMLMRLYDKYHCQSPGLVGIAAGEEADDWNGYEAVAITGGRLSVGSQVQVALPETGRAAAMSAAARSAGVKALLYVAGNNSSLRGGAAETAEALAAAVRSGGYDGLYLDLPQLNDSRRAALTNVVTALKSCLGESLLYVTVEAPAWQGKSYAAYDYAALSVSADRLVVRVAPYQKSGENFMTAPMEPLEEVYYALATLRDTVPAEKLCLQLTTTASVWKETKRDGTLTGAGVSALLAEETGVEQYYSKRYACAYLIRTAETPNKTVWYLNGQAAQERMQLCGLLGVDQICLSSTGSVLEELLAALR